MGVAVTFTDDSAAVAVDPGGQATCSVLIENTGMVVDGVLLDILGDAAEWAIVEPDQVNLLPGASAPAKIVFRPPRTASLPPGEVPFGLRAMSQEDPDGSKIEEGAVRVGEFSDLDLSLVPKSATGRRSAKYRLIIENRGNRQEDLRIEATDPDVKLSFRPRPAAFTAPAGTATFVRLVAVPRKTFFKGPSQSLPFDVTAQPEQGTSIKAQGVMLEKQTLPEWLLPMLGIAVLVAGLILALWLTVLRPIVHSATTAAAMASKAAGSAKSAAGSAKSAAKSAQGANSPPTGSPSALNVTLSPSTILTKTTELANVTGTFAKTAGSLPKLVWTSSNTKIAKVSQTGVVTGVSAGSATITATTSGKGGSAGSAGSSPSPSGSPSPGASPSPSGSPSPSPGPSSGSSSSVVSGSATVNVVGRVTVVSKVLTEAAIGKPYSTSLNATGGTGAFTWSISAGTLPPGLSLTPGTGAISGTPTVLGTTKFTVHVADAGPPTQFATKVVTLTVATPLAVNTSSLPGGTVGGPYSASLAAVGGTPPYAWSIKPGTGNLPGGLALNAKTGAITGTPTSAGTSSFVVQVTDAASSGQSSTESLSITVVNGLALSTLTLPTAVLNSPYSAGLSAFGGALPYTWSISSGSLPAGLGISPGSGALTGTPTSTGKSTFTVQVVDSGQPSLSASRTFTISVVGAFNATTSSLATAKVGQPYTAQLTATGGITPYVWALQGTLPSGLTLSPGGAITGTPTTTGIFSFTVQVVDSSSPPLSTTAALSITVVSPLAVTTRSLPEAVTGVAYAQNVEATGGTPPYTWSVTAGRLPRGLSLSSTTGAITGTPVNTGSNGVTITVRDSDTPTSHTASFTTSIKVVEPLNFTEPTLPDAFQSGRYPPTTPNHVSGGSGRYVWSITSGVLPAGLSLDSRTGTVSGQVNGSAALGTQNFTLTIADAKDPSITSNQQFSITVFPGLAVNAPQLTIVADQSFSQDLSGDVSGGKPPYRFSGSVDRLSIDPVSGQITGVPDAPCPNLVVNFNVSPATATCGQTTVTAPFTVTDADGNKVTVLITLTETVAPMLFLPAGSPLPTLHAAIPYNANVTAGGAQPTGGYTGVNSEVDFSFSTSPTAGERTPNNGGLPCDIGTCGSGRLGIGGPSGLISGTLFFPPINATWTFDVTITDTDPLNPSNTISVTYTLSISD